MFFVNTEIISGVEISAPVGKLLAGNSSANLSCSATTGSMLTVKWLKDGLALSSSSRVVFSADMKSVWIQPVQKEDNGEYTCQMLNPFSNQEAKVKLTVYCEYYNNPNPNHCL